MNDLLAKFLLGYTETNQWAAIMPEILLALLALGLLAAEMILPRARQGLIPRLAILGQLAILIAACCCPSTYVAETTSYFSGMIQQTNVTQIMRCFLSTLKKAGTTIRARA